MLQNELTPALKKARRRVGRGNGSGLGRTCGRGDKGQNARTGGGVRIGFEGGQTPLHKRLPKLKGFNNFRFAKTYETVNLSSLNSFKGNVTQKELLEKGLISKSSSLIKVLGNGEITVALIIKADKVSKIAKEKIEKAGGKVELTA